MEKISMKNKIAAWLLGILFIGPTWATTISIQPSSLTMAAGQIFSLNVDIAQVIDLYAFQLDVNFNPAVLSAVSVSEGPFLPSGGTTVFVPGTIDNFGGTITFNADSLVGLIPGMTGNGTLLTLDFMALATGSSSVELSNEILLDSNFGIITADNVGSVITVQAIPEPNTWGLVAIAFVASIWIRRQKC